MSPASEPEPRPLPLTVVGRVDRACDAFEAAWRAGQRPRLEDYLGDLPEPGRSGMLRELLAAGLELRRASGERPMPGDYSPRFPGCEALIADVFSGTTAPSGASDATKSLTPPDAARSGAAVGPGPGGLAAAGGRYRILRPHARGGLGEVFVAHDGELHREVALKQILDRRADDPASRARFTFEAEITGGLEHPGIVPVYGLGHDAHGRPYYAMRFIRGDSLKEAIERFHAPTSAGPDPGARALALRKLLGRFLDVCNAIEYAHSRGVLHRDLKPANIMLGKYGETLVVDWGLARPVDGGEGEAKAADEPPLRPNAVPGPATRAGSAVGTPAYMSPEQAAGDLEALGPASDVYCLGATLYCLLTGRAPFVEAPLGALLARVRAGEFPRPRAVRPEVPAALEAICLKAMALRPGDRYPSPRALAEDVERWLADEPISARREPAWVRLGRWARRHRTLVAVAAATLVVATVALAIAYRRESAINARLELARKEADRRLDQTLAAIEDYHTGVAKEVLLGQAEFAGLRRRLLERPRQFYEQLANDLQAAAADEPRARALLAKGRFGLGQLADDLGDPKAARRHFEAADAIYREMAAARPGDVASGAGRARCADGIGLAARRMGDQAGAEAAYRRAIGLWEALVADRRAGPEELDSLAGTLTGLSLVQAEAGDQAGAIKSNERAIEVWAGLVKQFPAKSSYRDHLAAGHNNLAMARSRQGDPAGAVAAYRAAIAHLSRLAAEDPAEPSYLSGLVLARADLGYDLTRLNDLKGADEAYRLAIEDGTKLVAMQPNAPSYRKDLAMAYGNRGEVYYRLGDLDAATAATRRALEQYEALERARPDVLEYLFGTGRCHANLGLLRSEVGDARGAEEAFGRAIAIYRRLADADPAVPEYREKLAGSYQNHGTTLALLGDHAGALESLKRAVADFDALVARHPEPLFYRYRLALALGDLGTLLSGQGDRAAAVAADRRAVAVFDELRAKQPDVPDYGEGAANALISLGDALTDDRPASIAAYRRAVGLTERLLARDPTGRDSRRLLGTALTKLAGRSAEVGDHRAGVEQVRRAVAILTKLAADHPAIPEYVETLAAARHGLGAALGHAGDRVGQVKELRLAVAALDKLRADQPGSPAAAVRLGAALDDLGLCELALGRPDDAERSLRRAIEAQEAALARTPDLPGPRGSLGRYRHHLGRVLRARGRPKEALAVARAFRDQAKGRPADLYDAACDLSLCAPLVGDDLRSAVADEAMDTLREAAAAGWSRPADAANDADLAPIRHRDDFRHLLGVLLDRTFPADPFAR